MLSDAFFPFLDCVEDRSVRQGSPAVVQPGGSINGDQDSMAYCDANGMSVMTGSDDTLSS